MVGFCGESEGFVSRATGLVGARSQAGVAFEQIGEDLRQGAKDRIGNAGDQFSAQ